MKEYFLFHDLMINRLWTRIKGYSIIGTMRTIEFTPSGICARHITIVLDDNEKVQDLSFVGGCDGNHKGLTALVKGMTADEAISRLSGITCGYKQTSCPDQVAVALKQALGR